MSIHQLMAAIHGFLRHLDVDSSHPEAEPGSKGFSSVANQRVAHELGRERRETVLETFYWDQIENREG